jgi:hypothetical protein
MIVDRSPLGGKEAYLQAGGSIELQAGGDANAGRSLELRDGMALELKGVHLQLEADDLEPLFAPAGFGTPLLELRVEKRLFQDIVADPYGHRTHTIGGFEDFRRGTLDNVEVLEVEGVPTLASVADDCRWLSPLYRMPPPEGVELAAAAWDLAASHLVAEDAFTYGLGLHVTFVDGSTHTVELADGTPRSDRAKPRLGPSDDEPTIRKVAAYQIDFRARVRHDLALAERAPGLTPRGTPLLSAVNLLERVDSPYAFQSLHELTVAAADWALLGPPDAPPRRFVCSVVLPALLGRGEGVTLTVRPSAFARVEARLDATRLLRPPIDDKG